MIVRLFLGILAILNICLCTSCARQNVAEKQNQSPSIDKTESVIDVAEDNGIPNTSEWKKTLADKGVLNADLDGNSKEDTITLTYEDLEGSQRVKDFYVTLNGDKKVSISNDENNNSDEQNDMSLSEVLAFDFNKDSLPEYLFLFDTHGAGGNGTYAAWILWTNDQARFEMLDCLDYYISGERDNSEEGLDTVYQIQQVEGDISKMKTYQYSYLGEHSNYAGDLVSIVEYDLDKKTFIVTDSWKENLR